MIKAVRIKEIINRETLGEKCKVMFTTVIGEDEEGNAQFGEIEADMHYYERGSEGKETILMLHGPGQSLYTYRNNFDVIAKEGYRILVPDLLGCGYSDCPEIDYTIEDMALSLRSFLANMGVTKTHIVAFGQSCAYAAEIANSDTELVSSMTFIHPGAFAATSFPKAKALCGMMGAMAANSFARPSFIANCFEMSYFDKTLITERNIEEYAKPFENADLKACLRSMTINFDDEEVLDKLMKYNKPILMVNSVDDTISNPDDYKRYLHCTQMGYTASFRNCGYLPHEEKDDMFNTSLLEFLNC